MVTPSIMIMGPDTPPATALVTASPDINVESPTDSQVSSSLDKKPTSFPGPRSTIKLEWPPASRNEDVSGSNTQNTTYLGVPPHDHSYASSPISTSSTQGREGSYRPSSTYSALRPILSSTSGSPGPTSPAAPKGFGSPSQIFVARADAQTLYALSDTRTVLSSLVSHKANSTALAAVSIFGTYHSPSILSPVPLTHPRNCRCHCRLVMRIHRSAWIVALLQLGFHGVRFCCSRG